MGGGLALGLRQGEALGLRWSDVDLTKATLWVRRGRLRPSYVHGCGGRCGRKAGFCPQRRNTRAETDDTKSRAGRRAIGLPAELVALLERHRDEQEKERVTAAQLWRDSGYVFTTPRGEPVNPNTDHGTGSGGSPTPAFATAASTTPGIPRRRCC